MYFNTGDLIELIGSFPNENYDYQTSNTNHNYDDPIIIYTDQSTRPVFRPNTEKRPNPDINRPNTDTNRPNTDTNRPNQDNRPGADRPDYWPTDFNQNHYFHVKPSYHETTTHFTNIEHTSADDYVPINGHVPQRPVFPGKPILAFNFKVLCVFLRYR